jgi:diguanylate cyclase (GGDEF)-like protein/PAS domain S-box-containing protein
LDADAPHTPATEYRSILETAHESFISMDAEGRIVEWNGQAETDFGWRRDEVIGRDLAETVVPARSRQAHRGGLARLLASGEGRMLGRRVEMQALHRDGHEFPVEMTVSALRGKDGYTFHAFLHDISERYESERALREAEERFRRAFDDAAIGMAIVSPDGEWLQVNQALADLTGYSKAELTGKSFHSIVHPDDLGDYVQTLDHLVSGRGQRFVGEKRYLHADGRVVWITVSVSTVRDERGGVLYLISQMQDITERRLAEAKLAHRALHDPLTGLPNRSLFNDRMELARARLRRGGSLALLFCDLDYFKLVNDGLGHEPGDRLLIEVAERLRAVVRPSDTVSRFGGDEFAVLCEGVDVNASEAIACRIADAFAEPFSIDRHEVCLSSSTGIVLSRDRELDLDQLLQDADRAMYEAKAAGGSSHVVFRPEMRGRWPGEPPVSTEITPEVISREALGSGPRS